MEYTKGSVVSADGTTIGYRQMGSGPAIIVMHGGMQASQYFMKLGAALAGDFTVYIPDRRGRGLSGPHGDNFTGQRFVEDVAALVEATGAERIFGLSSGAIITLRSALAIPSLRRIAVYEPPLSVNGSSPVGWVPQYESEIAEGKLSDAVVTALKGMGVEPVMSRVPRAIIVPALRVGLKSDERTRADDVSIASLIPTLHYDMVLVAETADTLDDYRAIDADVLLLGGSKSPGYLHTSLDALEGVLPHVRRVTFAGLRHSGPDDDGDPARVAAELLPFFTAG